MFLPKQIPTKTIIILSIILIPLGILLAHQAVSLKYKQPEEKNTDTPKYLKDRTPQTP